MSTATEPGRVTLPLAQDSVAQRLGNDPRTVLLGPALLLLQVAHPVVGAGVAQHSDYAHDPFGRLFRTLGAITEVVYGGPKAPQAGAEVRSFHRSIKGTLPDGSRYTAFDPEAWAWVHATLGWGMHRAAEQFGRPLTPAASEQLWAEWLAVGELLRVRPGDLPATWSGVRSYVEAMVQERLERTEAFESVLGTFQRVRRPSALPLPFALWNGLALPVTVPLSVLAAGPLPGSARGKLGIRWGIAQQPAYLAGCLALRAMGPVATRMARMPWPVLAGRADATVS